MALLAGAVGTVERKRARLQLRNAGAAFGAGQFLRIQALFAVDHHDQHQPIGELRRSFDRGFQALFDAGLDQQPVHHHFDGVILAFIERDIFVQGTQNPIDTRSYEALASEFLQLLLIFALPAADDGCHDHQPVFGLERQHMLEYLLRGLARDFVAADGAVRHADGGVQQAQVIVDFSNGADCGAGTPAGSLLLDGNGRAQSIDGIHIGAFHLVEELAGIGGECFHVTALPLCVNCVESERGFAGTAEPGDDRQRVSRDFDIDVLQIVLAGAMHRYEVQHTNRRWVRGLSYCRAYCVCSANCDITNDEMKCAQCGGQLRRVHRTFFERFGYMAIYECHKCEREEFVPRRYRYHLGPSCRCPLCGTYRVVRLKEPDKIDRKHGGFLNLVERLLGKGRMFHCRWCRLQFFDRRSLAAEVKGGPQPAMPVHGVVREVQKAAGSSH